MTWKRHEQIADELTRESDVEVRFGFPLPLPLSVCLSVRGSLCSCLCLSLCPCFSRLCLPLSVCPCLPVGVWSIRSVKYTRLLTARHHPQTPYHTHTHPPELAAPGPVETDGSSRPAAAGRQASSLRQCRASVPSQDSRFSTPVPRGKGVSTMCLLRHVYGPFSTTKVTRKKKLARKPLCLFASGDSSHFEPW